MDCADPTFRNQLRGGPTQGEDCGVVSTAIALDFITCGQVDRGVRQIRRSMGVPSGPTRTLDQVTALREFALSEERLARLRERGLRLPRVRRRVLVPFEEARDALREGRGVIIPLAYHVVNRRAPRLSGDRAFMGMHSVFSAAIRERDGARQWLIHDPLYNVPGEVRRPVPTGPQWWPEWLVRRAAGRMNVLLGVNPDGSERRGEVGIGRIVFVEVTRPRPRPPEEPEEEPEAHDRGVVPATEEPDAEEEPGVDAVELDPAILRERIARWRRRTLRLREELAEREAEAAAAEERIEELEATIGSVSAALAAVVDGAGAETAI